MMRQGIYVKHKKEIRGNEKFVVYITGASLLLLLLLLLLKMRAQQKQRPQLLLCIIVSVHISAQDVVSASVHIYCLKHYTAHIESDRKEHFVQHTGTFSELFMLVCVLAASY